jgi:hypothetical protein
MPAATLRERLAQRRDVLVHGVDDERCCGRGGAERRHEGKAVMLREREVQKYQVNVRAPAQRCEPLGRRGSLEQLHAPGHHADHFAQRGADERMIIDGEHDHRSPCTFCWGRAQGVDAGRNPG